MDEQPRVFRAHLAVSPRARPPLEFEDEVVIAVFVLRRERAQTVSCDVQHPVRHAEHVPRVLVFRVFKKGVESGERLSVKQPDDAVPGADGRGLGVIGPQRENRAQDRTNGKARDVSRMERHMMAFP